jgi:cell wall-associated NlpC family hydrolase
MRTEFRVRRAGGETFAQVKDLDVLEEKLHHAIQTVWPTGERFRIAQPGSIHDFGVNKPEDTIVQIVVRRIPDIDPGDWFVIAKDGSDARLRVRNVAVAEGSKVLQAAFNQLGDEYVFGSHGPDEFDCSGLARFCYSHVEIDLRPPARDQFKDPQVTVFHERSMLKDGDLVFYDTKEDGQVDHVGIVDVPGSVVDASSTQDKVVHREIDANHVLAFGRIQEVNGPLV